jgi:hypothetical protein
MDFKDKKTVQTSVMSCEFVGGPLDGAATKKNLEIIPGQAIRFGHVIGKRKYVYQARPQPEDESPLVMEFVQVVGKNDDISG